MTATCRSLAGVQRVIDAVAHPKARVKRVYLTRKGSALARKSIKIQVELVDGMMQTFTDDELGTDAIAMQRSSEQLKTTR